MGNDQSKVDESRQPLLKDQRQAQHRLNQQLQPQQQWQPQLLQQQSTMSAEEVRRRRLEKLEKKDILPQRGLPVDFVNHSIAKEYGNQAYLIHMLFEDIYKNTFHKSSLQRNPGLKLLQTQEKQKEILLFTVENFENVIPDLLESDMFYQTEEKLGFLIEVSQRLKSTDQLGLISDNKKSELQKMTLSFLMNYLTAPQIFSPEIIQENLGDPLDCGCILNDIFYKKMIEFQNEEFFNEVLLNLQDYEYETILTPIFKRIKRDCLQVSIDNISKCTMAMSLLGTLLSKDERIVEFFVNHSLFLPKNSNITGLNLQKETIFGACLSLTTLVEESSSATNYFSTHEKINNIEKALPDLRSKIHTLIDGLHRIMELVIKSNQKFKRNLLDWFYCVLTVNELKQKESPGLTVSSHGWFVNFVTLLLKFCQKLLEDPNTYPNWVTKIDLVYLQEKPIFDGVILLNGQKNLVFNKQEELLSEDKKPKFSFLTELLFITSHALLLQKKAIKDFATFAQQISLKIRSGQITNEAQNLNKYIGYSVQFQDPYLYRSIFKLLTFQALLILHSYDIPIKSLEMPFKLFDQLESLKLEYFEQRPSLPVYWIDNIYEYLECLGLLGPKDLCESPKCLEILMNFLLSIVKNNEWINLPHVKIGCLNFFTIFKTLFLYDKTLEKEFHFVFKQNPYFEQNIVNVLIETFIEAEKYSSQYVIYEKLNCRLACCFTLEHLLAVIFPQNDLSYPVKSLNKIMYSSNGLYKKFVFAFLEDITFLLDDCFSKLRELYFSDNYMNTSFVFVENSQNLHIINEKSELTKIFGILKEYYSFGLSICKVFPEFLLSKEVQEKFISCLNYSINVLNCPDLMNLNLSDLRLLQNSPEYLIQNVLKIVIILSDKEEIIKNITFEENFNIENLNGIIKIISQYNLLKVDKMTKLIQLVSKLENSST